MDRSIGLAGLAFLLLGFAPPCSAGELDDVKNGIKKKGANWVAGDNSVSRLPGSERLKRVGAKKPTAGGLTVSGTSGAILPGTLDYRNFNGQSYVTLVKDQGSCGSCWAFGTSAALESYIELQRGLPGVNLDLAEQIVLSCSGAGSCSGGYPSGAAAFIQKTGVPPETYDAYTAANGTCPAASAWQTAASSYTVGSWAYVCSGTANVDAMKNALVSYGPLAAQFSVYSDFYYYSSGVYSYVSGSYQGDHEVEVVGYDDGAQAFIVKNSWGTGWGQSGYFLIAYSEAASVVHFGYYTIAFLSGAPAPSCSFTLSPMSQSVPAAGGTGTISVTTTGGCNWSASSSVSWITITGIPSGQGSGTVGFSVAANSGKARNGVISIGGQSFKVSQAGSVSPGKGHK